MKIDNFLKNIQIVLFNIQETSSNLDIESAYTAFPVENRDLFHEGLTTIVPIIGGGERLGTLILARLQEKFHDDDLNSC